MALWRLSQRWRATGCWPQRTHLASGAPALYRGENGVVIGDSARCATCGGRLVIQAVRVFRAWPDRAVTVDKAARLCPRWLALQQPGFQGGDGRAAR